MAVPRARYSKSSLTLYSVPFYLFEIFTYSAHLLPRRCDMKRTCRMAVNSDVFGDPCPGTHKYVEVHYACKNKAAAASTTKKPLPPWFLESGGGDIWRQNKNNDKETAAPTTSSSSSSTSTSSSTR